MNTSPGEREWINEVVITGHVMLFSCAGMAVYGKNGRGLYEQKHCSRFTGSGLFPDM